MNLRSLLLPLYVIVRFARTAAANHAVVVSVPDQKLASIDHGVPIAQLPVSMSKFGVGDKPGSYATPLGMLEIAAKIGANARLGAVFKQRRMRREISRPNSPRRDPIVPRILWLRSLEKRNAGAFAGNTYINGTPVERLIGRPASYGCIRMRSREVVALFSSINVGTKITVLNEHLHNAITGAAPGFWSGTLAFAPN
jgi:hypothetical protein